MTMYSIPAHNYEYLLEKIEDVNKKARKLHVTETSVAITKEYLQEKVINVDTGETANIVYYDIEVTSFTPILNGYEFIATIVPIMTEDDTQHYNTVRAVPGKVSDTLFTHFAHVDMTCEHCHINRYRNEVYIVRHVETGQLMQVGKSCLKDFVGHANAEKYASWCEELTLLDDMCTEASDDEHYSYRHDRFFAIEDYLELVSATIHAYGWISRGKAEETFQAPTSTLALSALTDKRLGKKSDIKITQRDKELTQDALVWIRSITENTITSDYLYNLWVSCKGISITHKQCGIVASLFVAYQKAIEKEIIAKKNKEQALQSEHVGNIKEKLFDIPVTCTFTKVIEGQYVSILHKFVDEKGNIYTWFSSSVELKQGEKYLLNGTIKGHDTYNGMKQTVLTRCKCVETSLATH